MSLSGRAKPVVNGYKGKFSFITIDSTTEVFQDGKTKVNDPVTDDHMGTYSGKAIVVSTKELRVRLKCEKEPKAKKGPDPGELTITLMNPNDTVNVKVDYVVDDEM